MHLVYDVLPQESSHASSAMLYENHVPLRGGGNKLSQSQAKNGAHPPTHPPYPSVVEPLCLVPGTSSTRNTFARVFHSQELESIMTDESEFKESTYRLLLFFVSCSLRGQSVSAVRRVPPFPPRFLTD